MNGISFVSPSPAPQSCSLWFSFVDFQVTDETSVRETWLEEVSPRFPESTLLGTQISLHFQGAGGRGGGSMPSQIFRFLHFDLIFLSNLLGLY